MVIIFEMSYKALYLKYRPQTFNEVAGQSAIKRTLENSLKLNKIAHAYLFAGPRGTGKTTMARLFAKALACEEGLGHQCNKCQNCLDITAGTHPDVIEIDAASNNGVEQVRDLVEKARYSPIRCAYKVYIIDEVHMMSSGAFNALLKTLEEPPEHVIFILATTEPQKVLPTIISRCQRFDFAKVDEVDMENKIKEVLASEGATYEEEALKEVVSLADGGMRDALSILDQALSYSNNSLKLDDLLSIYGLVSKAEKISLLKAIATKNASQTLTILDGYKNGGIDIRRLNSDLLNILKDLLIYLSTKNAKLLETLNEAESSDLSGVINLDSCLYYLDNLMENVNNFKNASSIHSLFEISLLKLIGQTSEKPLKTEVKLPKLEEIAPKPEVKETAPDPEPEPLPEVVVEEAKPLPVTEPKVEEPKPEPQPVVENKPAPSKTLTTPPSFLFEEEENPLPEIDTKGLNKINVVTDGDRYEISDDVIIQILVLGNKEERKKLSTAWASLEPLRNDPKLGPLASLLHQGKPFCVTEEALVLSYQFRNLKERALLKANQKPLQELLKRLLGRNVFIVPIDHSDQNRITNHYYNLQMVKQLPKKEEINLVLPKVEG